MKKILLLLTVLCYCISMSSQVMRAEELEKYAKENMGIVGLKQQKRSHLN